MSPISTRSTRKIAATAALTLLAGLGTAAVTTSGQAQAASSTAPKVARFEVTATVSTTEPVQGDKIKVRGSVTPATKGATVVLQKRYGTSGEWKKAATDTLNGQGKFQFKEAVGSVRFRQYRVVKAAAGATKSGQSKKLGVTVYGWRSLTSFQPVSNANTYAIDNVNINAVGYKASVVGSSTASSGSIAYNINRGCKTLEGRFGLSDVSDSTATGAITLSADGTSTYAHSFGLTQSEPVARDVTGVFRLTVDWTSTNTAGTPTDQSGAVIAIGSPRLLCNF